jgi:hypothetical protein
MVREDPEVSEMVTQRFRDEGITVLLNHQAKAFVVEDGEKILLAEHQGEEVRIPFDILLVAVGRAANLTATASRNWASRGSDDRPTPSCKRNTRTFTPPATSPGPSSSPTRLRTRPGTRPSMRSSTPSRSSAPITR